MVVKQVSWAASNLPLNRHEQDLREGAFSQADTVQRVVGGLESTHRIEIARGIWFTHVLFWLSLILLYPRFPQVQAIFFLERLGAAIGGDSAMWVSCSRGSLH